MSSTKIKFERDVNVPVRFFSSAVSGMSATALIQPLDMVKTRLQVDYVKRYSSGVHCFSEICRKEGPWTLYNGLSAALARQMSYGMIRLGIFDTLQEADMQRTNRKSLPILTKAGYGLMAGGIGSWIGNPTEVALVRMTADGRMPIEQRRNYTSVMNAIRRIAKEEGIATLWRGCSPTVIRAMCLNMAQFTTYWTAKEYFLENHSNIFRDNYMLHGLCGLMAGTMAACFSLPADNIKSKVQNMAADPKTGKLPYKGPADCLFKTINNQGVTALWRGLPTFIIRLSPHAIFVLIFYEQMIKTYRTTKF